MMEAIHSSEVSILTRVTRRHIPEDGILHNSPQLKNSNLTQESYPLAQLTDTVFSVRYEPQILSSNHIPQHNWQLWCFPWGTSPKSYIAITSFSITDRYSVFRKVGTSHLKPVCRFHSSGVLLYNPGQDISQSISDLHRPIANVGLNDISRLVCTLQKSDRAIAPVYFLFVVMKWVR
jgi:hypothetical protein